MRALGDVSGDMRHVTQLRISLARFGKHSMLLYIHGMPACMQRRTVDAATRQRPQGGLRLRARLKGRMQASSARSGQRLVQREPGPGALARARDSVADSGEQGPGARQKLGGEVLWTAR